MIKELFKVEIDMEQKMCNFCIRSSEEFFEMKIQIRYSSDINTEYENSLKKDINKILIWYKDIINIINKKNNKNNKEIDIFFKKNVSYNKIYNFLSKNYLITFKKSNKLVGFDKEVSKKRYKNTFLFEIIDIKKNDKILFKGKEYRVKSIFKNNITLIDLATNNKTNITYSINKDIIKKI